MSCPACGADLVAFSVPDEYRGAVPDPEDERGAAAALCSRCLSLEPADEPAADPDFSTVSDAFPTGEAAVPFALALGLCSSLATNRATVESLLERVERAGADPLLAMDRLAADPTLDPEVDLERRRHQLEQLR